MSGKKPAEKPPPTNIRYTYATKSHCRSFPWTTKSEKRGLGMPLQLSIIGDLPKTISGMTVDLTERWNHHSKTSGRQTGYTNRVHTKTMSPSLRCPSFELDLGP